jgi:cellular nucleic acid-binding protein
MVNHTVSPKALGNYSNNSNSSSVPITCFNCQKKGHYANVCQSPAFCPLCQRAGHSLRDCRNKQHSSPPQNNPRQPATKQRPLFCNYCKKKGHTASNCRSKNSQNNNKKPICSFCSKIGHLESNCRNKITCSSCLRTGHLAKECRQHLVCTNCGKKGHLTNNCRIKPGTRSVPTCSFCKKKGHIENNCRNKSSSLTTPICSYCHKKGHSEDSCRKKSSLIPSCSHCKKKGHKTEDCRSINTNQNQQQIKNQTSKDRAKKWPSKRVSDDNTTQLLKEYNWTSSAIEHWFDFVRFNDFQVFYMTQARKLELYSTNQTKKVNTFVHWFDGSSVELDIPSVGSELRKAKLLEFKKGINLLQDLTKKSLDAFTKEASSMATSWYSSKQDHSYLSILSQEAADAISKLDAGKPNYESVLKKMKAFAEYVKEKIETTSFYFESQLQECISNVETEYAKNKSRIEAKSIRDNLESKVTNQSEDVLDQLNRISQSILNSEQKSPQPMNPPQTREETQDYGHVARAAASRHNSPTRKQ